MLNKNAMVFKAAEKEGVSEIKEDYLLSWSRGIAYAFTQSFIDAVESKRLEEFLKIWVESMKNQVKNYRDSVSFGGDLGEKYTIQVIKIR